MPAFRPFALLAGLAAGYALARRAGLCDDGGLPTWGALVTVGAVGALAYTVAELALDHGGDRPGAD